jgi:hypothetical protein
MQSNQSCKIWTLSEDKKAYDRYSYLLGKPDVKGISVVETNNILIEKGAASFIGDPYVVLLHDESNIRKEYSEKMEALGKVKALDGGLVNGYHTLNSVALGQDCIHLLSCTPYSTKEEDYKNEASENNFDGKSVLLDQLKNISVGFKKKSPTAVLIHIIDRGEDDQNVFDYIDQELGDKFAIRLKLNRNSRVKTWSEEKGKEVAVKIAKKAMKSNFEQQYKVFSWRGKCFKNAKAKISYEHFYLGSNQYNVVRIQMYDSGGRKIFKKPMLIATSFEIKNTETALRVFHLYLKRSKIEGVFKFLKTELGWEEFQVQELLAIKHIIILCYFVGAYFCELEPELLDNEFMQLICKLGGGKNKVTRHFFLKGLQKLYSYESMLRFFKEQNLSPEDIQTLFKTIK